MIAIEIFYSYLVLDILPVYLQPPDLTTKLMKSDNHKSQISWNKILYRQCCVPINCRSFQGWTVKSFEKLQVTTTERIKARLGHLLWQKRLRLVPTESAKSAKTDKTVGAVRCGGVVGVVGLLASNHKINTPLEVQKHKWNRTTDFLLLIWTFSVPLYNNLLVKIRLFHTMSKHKLIQLWSHISKPASQIIVKDPKVVHWKITTGEWKRGPRHCCD